MLLRCILLALAVALPAWSADVTIAAASDLTAVLRELGPDFEHQSGHRAVVSFGSSGNFYSQIRNGAPYDVFMSADAEYPRKLIASGEADPASFFRYGRGSIVVWVPSNSKLDPQSLKASTLLDSSISKIAIANPKHAPYGRAAEAALKSLGIYSQLAPKLVVGENISQAAQFVETGNAQVGIIALSLALAPAMRGKGKYWQIPDSAYPPLEQSAVVISRSQKQAGAREFIEYLKTASARAILERYGFRSATP